MNESSKKGSKEHRKLLVTLFIAFIIVIFLCQTQPVIISMLGGVDGSFGLRPKTHGCIGFTLDSSGGAFKIFPQGDLSFTLYQFSFAYRVKEYDSPRDYCLGQDVWFGE